MKMEKEFFPVGREIAGIVLDGKFSAVNTYMYFTWKLIGYWHIKSYTLLQMQNLIIQKCFPF